MPANKVQVPRISDAVAASLEKRILEGSLKPGDRLPPERELAAELGVSRPSLREAIQKLASKGMLQSRQGGGTYVTDRLESTFSDPWRAMMGSHPNLREDLLEFRRMLEGQAAEWAAERATEADLQRLEQAFAAMTEAFAGDDLERRSKHRHRLPPGGGEAAHNALIGHLSAAAAAPDARQHPPQPRRTEDHSVGDLAARQPARGHLRGDPRPQAGEARAAAETHIDFVAETLAQTLRSVARRESAARRLQSAHPRVFFRNPHFLI